MSRAHTDQSDKELETRRLQAWDLHQLGWSQLQIAAVLGVTQGAISQWLKRVRDGGGIEELRHHPAPGKQASLTQEQFAQIPALIARGASAFGFDDGEWTTKRIASMLKQVFGVSYHPGHVSRLLQKHCPEWRDYKQI